MKLLFVNDSRQRRELIETDYAEDVYDTIISFFEDNRVRPHFLEIANEDEVAVVSFGSMSEKFVVEDIEKEDIEIIRSLILNH